MNTKKLTALALACTLAGCASNSYLVEKGTLPTLETKETASDAYVSNLVRTYLSGQEDNAAVSPANLYVLLGILAQCAQGETQTKLLDVLDAESLDQAMRASQTLLSEENRKEETGTSTLAASLWLNEKMDWKEDTLSFLAQNWDTDIYKGPMGNENYEESLAQWIEQAANGQIQTDNLGQTEQTALQLCAAMSFSANWCKTFTDAEMNIFYGTEEQEVPFMDAIMNAAYVKEDHWTAAGLGLEDGSVFWIVLPETSLEEALADWTMEAMKTNASYQRLYVSMPKFSTEDSSSLESLFERLGLASLFKHADLSALTDEDLAVVQATQNIKISADEDGLEAAGYTIISMDATALPMETDPIPFKADKPFFFLLESAFGNVLAAGQVKRID